MTSLGQCGRALALALCVAAPTAAWAQEEDAAFKQGLKARERQQWAEVIAQMRKAIAADGKESSRKVGRNLFSAGTEYVPYYFLGEAYFRQGDCANAVVSWSTSEQHGAVREKAEFMAGLRQGMSACETKGVLLPARFDPLAARANQQIAELRTRFTRVKELGEQHADIWRGTAAFGETYGKALAEDQNARTHLTAAFKTRTEKEFTEVFSALGRASSLLESLESDLRASVARGDTVAGLRSDIQRALQDGRSIDAELETQKAHLSPALMASRADGMKALARAAEQVAPRTTTESAATAARALANEGLEQLRAVQTAVRQKLADAVNAQMERALAKARETFAQVEASFSSLESLITSQRAKDGVDVAGLRDAARKKFEAARRRLGAALRDKKVADVASATASAEQLRAELLDLQSHFGPVTLEALGVPPWLQAGADLYFRGEYGRALETLHGGATDNPTARAHAHMLQAAAHYALWVRSRELDQARANQAVAEIARCRALAPDLVPDSAWFSPRFIEFFRRGGAAAPGAQASR